MMRSLLTMPDKFLRVRKLSSTFILSARLLWSRPQHFIPCGVCAGISSP
jgi:hypothetical protein